MLIFYVNTLGCYNRDDKGASYTGPVEFAANGLRCLEQENYEPFCRNPGGKMKKPSCWTEHGRPEECDIPICGMFVFQTNKT